MTSVEQEEFDTMCARYEAAVLSGDRTWISATATALVEMRERRERIAAQSADTP